MQGGGRQAALSLGHARLLALSGTWGWLSDCVVIRKVSSGNTYLPIFCTCADIYTTAGLAHRILPMGFSALSHLNKLSRAERSRSFQPFAISLICPGLSCS